LNILLRKTLITIALALFAASPGVSLLAQDGTPDATAAACTPLIVSGPVTDSHVRQQVILDEMRGHLLVSLALWQAGEYLRASVHAAHPAGELLSVITGDLRRACLYDGLVKALTGFVELTSKASEKDSVEKAHVGVLGLLDQASAGMIPAEGRNDAGFHFRVIAGVLTDAGHEYAESVKDGKVTDVVEYEDALGFFQAARARYDAVKAGLTQKAPDLDKSLEANWKTLADAFPGVKPPETPADPTAIASAIDALTKTGAQALGVTLEAKLTPIEYLVNTQHELAEALELYEKGQADEAYEAAAVAYLENFEYAEAALGEKDKELMETIEVQMKAFRDAIKAGKPVDEVKAILAQINPNIEKAIALLSQ
jgi:hypothetical protein